MKDRVFVIDVETIGLHGPAFAVGFVLMDFSGNIENEGIFALRPEALSIDDPAGMKWALENVHIEDYNCKTLEELRFRFWDIWTEVRTRSIMAADVVWPCESNFLSSVIATIPGSTWEGPYPLLDIASFRMGADDSEAMKTEIRLSDELPAHNPLMDARQSARQLSATIKNSIRAVNILSGL